MSLLANVGRLFLLRVSGQFGLLLLIVHLTRVLSPAALGEYFYFESLLGILALTASFGIGGTVEKFISEGTDKNTWYSTGLVLLVIFALVTSGGFVLVNTEYIQILRSEYVPLLFVALLSKQMVTYYRHMFRAEFRASIDGVLDGIRILSFILIALLLVKLNYGPLGIIVGAIFGRIIVLPIAATMTERSVEMPDFSRAIEIIQFAKFYFITVVGSKVFHFADIIIVGILLTKTDVGRYEVAWRLILAAIMLNGVIASTAFAYISRSSTVKDLSLVADNIEQSLRYVLIIPFGCVVGAAIIGTDIINEMFTSAYVADKSLILILAFGFVFQAFYFLFSRSLIAINEPKQSFYATLISVLSNIVLNIILIQIFGIIGAAAATTISFAIASITYYYLLQKHITFSLPIRRFIVQITGAVIMGFVLWSVKLNISKTTTFLTGFLFLLGGMIYAVVLLTHERTRSDILQLFGKTSP